MAVVFLLWHGICLAGKKLVIKIRQIQIWIIDKCVCECVCVCERERDLQFCSFSCVCGNKMLSQIVYSRFEKNDRNNREQ